MPARAEESGGIVPMLVLFVRRHPRDSALTLVLLLLAGLFEGFGVVMLLPLLDSLLNGSATPDSTAARLAFGLLDAAGLPRQVTYLVLFALIGICLKAALTATALRQAGYAAVGLSRDLRIELIRNLARARWDFFVNEPLGVMTNAVSAEAFRTAQCYLITCRFLATSLQCLIYLAIAFLTVWWIALAGVVLGGLILWLLRNFVSLTRKAGSRQTQSMRDLQSRMTDVFGSVKSLKVMGRETHIIPIIEDVTERLNQAMREQVFNRAMLQSMQEPLIAVTLGLCLFATVALTPTTSDQLLFLAFIFYRIVGRATWLQKLYQDIVRDESAFWSLRQLIERSEAAREPNSTGTQAHLKQGIRFEHVGFLRGDVRILEDISLTIPVGSMATITGPSGAGKTTLVDLLNGLYEVSEGDIWIDDVSLRHADIQSWRRQIGYVGQDLLMLNDSVLRNVTLADPAITRAAVEKALRAADIWDFVSDLPEGVDTMMGERGYRFSGGQRQRIAIARALVGDPELLVLDEPTTALDPQTEAGIIATLGALRGKTTILAVSHQNALIDAADRVYHLSAGRLSRIDEHRRAGQGAGR